MCLASPCGGGGEWGSINSSFLSKIFPYDQNNNNSNNNHNNDFMFSEGLIHVSNQLNIRLNI